MKKRNSEFPSQMGSDRVIGNFPQTPTESQVEPAQPSTQEISQNNASMIQTNLRKEQDGLIIDPADVSVSSVQSFPDTGRINNKNNAVGPQLN